MRIDHWSFYWVTILAILSVVAIPRPERFAYLLPVAYLWTANLRLGITLNGFKVVAFAYMVSIVVSGLLPAGRAIPRRARLLLLVLYIIGVSLYGVLNLPPEIPFLDVLYSDMQRPPYRQILQIVLWLASMLCSFMAFRGISNANDFARCLRVTFVSIAVAAVVSVVLITSSTFAPAVGSLLSKFFSYAESAFQGGFTLRVASFSGEPRYYGRAMSIAACLAILCRVFALQEVPSWVRKPSVIGTLVLLALLSASVTTAGASVLGLAAVFAWLVLRRERVFSLNEKRALATTGIRSGILRYSRSTRPMNGGHGHTRLTTTPLTVKAQGSSSKGRIIVYGLATFGLVFIFLFKTPLLQQRINSYLRAGGIHIASSSVDIRGEEGKFGWNAYIRWLSSKPEYLVFGSGLGNAAFHAYSYLLSTSPWVGPGFLTTRLPFLEGLGSLGLIGMSMMLLLLYLWWRDLGRIAKKCPPQEYYAIQVCRGMVIFLVASSLFQDTFPLVWFFLGAGFGCGSVCEIGRSKLRRKAGPPRLSMRSPTSTNRMRVRK